MGVRHQRSAIDTQVGDLAHKRISRCLEDQIRRHILSYAFWQLIAWSRQQINNRIHELLHANLTIGSHGEYRHHSPGGNRSLQPFPQIIGAQLFAFEVHHHQIVIGFGNCFYQLFRHVSDIAFQEVLYSRQSFATSLRGLNSYAHPTPSILNYAHDFIEISLRSIEFVYNDHSGQLSVFG